MVYSIFTYMNGWCFLCKCRYIYQSHGSYEVVIVDRCGLTQGFEKKKGLHHERWQFTPEDLQRKKPWKVNALEPNDLRALKSRGPYGPYSQVNRPVNLPGCIHSRFPKVKVGVWGVKRSPFCCLKLSFFAEGSLHKIVPKWFQVPWSCVFFWGGIETGE